jgi:EAL domain-containing protein (putative c-di-GMP-specific phosphodiesterase class I)
MLNRDDGFRYLGFAFASADVLFEVDAAGKVSFVLGAVRRVLGRADVDLLKTPWEGMFEPEDLGLVAALFESLAGVARKGPVRARLKTAPGAAPRYANLYACRLPQLAPNISCALSLGRDGFIGAEEKGLLDRQAFDEVVARLLADARDSGLDVELALVEVAGLATSLKSISSADREKTMAGLTDVLRAESLRGAAARIEEERFAIVRERPEGPDTLTNRLKLAAARAGVDVNPTAALLQLEDAGSAQGLRALRFTLDRFLKSGMPDKADVSATFKEGLDGTLREAKAFNDSVKSRQFKLVYQPIVDLRTRKVHHYEALTRFPKGEGPFETIRMAEELDLIEQFDLAVAETAIAALGGRGPDVSVAVNISGRSFLQPRFIDRLLGLMKNTARLKDRLMFEITESAALANLDLADERIQRLRRAGFKVCIDDFGAGAASLSYLRNLTVDIVKIDGQFIQSIGGGGRDDVFVRHLTALCKELKVVTIGEMVETETVAEALKTMAVDLGQGFLFGAPLAELPDLRGANTPARRVGAVESWG